VGAPTVLVIVQVSSAQPGSPARASFKQATSEAITRAIHIGRGFIVDFTQKFLVNSPTKRQDQTAETRRNFA
jgi:hypothetical protein